MTWQTPDTSTSTNLPIRAPGIEATPALRRCKLRPTVATFNESDGTPIFLLSDTTWLLPARYTLAELTAHAKVRAAQGFTALQMTASFPENGYQALDTVFTASDFTRPVSSYWSALDEKIKVITDAGLVVILNPFWKKTSDATISSNGNVKCRAYGKWVATRYRDNPRVAYFLGGDSSPGTVRDQIDAIPGNNASGAADWVIHVSQ